MLLTRPAFWYLPDLRFSRCLGRFGPKTDPSFDGGFLRSLGTRTRQVSSRLLTVRDAVPTSPVG
jgi:hypothetical protein